MIKIFRGIHAGWTLLIFVLLFALFFIPFLFPIAFPKQHKWVGIINRTWAVIFYHITFIPYQLEYRLPIDRSKQYIFCPNHFSYLDIPTMGLNKFNTIFVGKSEMGNIPIFGYMYRKLHITVNRESLKSRYNTLVRTLQAIEEGKNLVIFPEGGMLTKKPPEMVRFKDGAFRAAIEKQIPIIPVTIPFNWIILPDSTWLPKIQTMKVIYHEPIETSGLTLADIDTLKQQTYAIIDNELKHQLQ